MFVLWRGDVIDLILCVWGPNWGVVRVQKVIELLSTEPSNNSTVYAYGCARTRRRCSHTLYKPCPLLEVAQRSVHVFTPLLSFSLRSQHYGYWRLVHTTHDTEEMSVRREFKHFKA